MIPLLRGGTNPSRKLGGGIHRSLPQRMLAGHKYFGVLPYVLLYIYVNKYHVQFCGEHSSSCGLHIAVKPFFLRFFFMYILKGAAGPLFYLLHGTGALFRFCLRMKKTKKHPPPPV